MTDTYLMAKIENLTRRVEALENQLATKPPIKPDLKSSLWREYIEERGEEEQAFATLMTFSLFSTRLHTFLLSENLAAAAEYFQTNAQSMCGVDVSDEKALSIVSKYDVE